MTSLQLYHLSPGHLLRRLHQVAIGIFIEETGGDITPIQFASLAAIAERPLTDIKGLAALVALDRSTLGDVVGRLAAMHYVKRVVNRDDRRARIVEVTPQGLMLLKAVAQKVKRAQSRIVRPLSARNRSLFLEYLKRLVDGNNGNSRAPLVAPCGAGARSLSFQDHPGHLVRRLRQICDGIFFQFAEAFDITPVQYSTLTIASYHPQIDNTRLAQLSALDQATMSGILRRLAAKGWIDIKRNATDRRSRSLHVSASGKQLLAGMQPLVNAIEIRTLDVLSSAEAALFLKLLIKILESNNEGSRAPFRDLSDVKNSVNYLEA